jgi:hypothetical protein
MVKNNIVLTILVVALMSAAYAVGESDDMKLQETTQEAFDACSGKSEGNSCEYTNTGTKVVGVCQKNIYVNDVTKMLICQ